MGAVHGEGRSVDLKGLSFKFQVVFVDEGGLIDDGQQTAQRFLIGRDRGDQTVGHIVLVCHRGGWVGDGGQIAHKIIVKGGDLRSDLTGAGRQGLLNQAVQGIVVKSQSLVVSVGGGDQIAIGVISEDLREVQGIGG